MKKTNAMRGIKNELEFDLGYWLRKYRLTDLEDLFVSATGPDTVFFGELIRRAAGIDSNDEDFARWHVPCDLFVAGCGPGPRRDMTGYGGLPYRPADQPWPVSSKTSNRAGQPLMFICQFRLRESTDILGELPGDLLLVFAETNGDWSEPNIDPPFCEWQRLGISEKDLTRDEDIPEEITFRIPASYAVRHRYTDLVDFKSTFLASSALAQLPQTSVEKYYHGPFDVAFLQMVRGWVCQSMMLKAGGVPYLDCPVKWMYEKLDQGRFLVQIPPPPSGWNSSTSWLNCETEVEFDAMEYQTIFRWEGKNGEDGTLLLYLQDSGAVTPRFAHLF